MLFLPPRFLFALLVPALVPGQIRAASADPAREIFFADPTIFAEHGTYYRRGTRDATPPGFAVLQSTNLRDWSPVDPDHLLLRAGDAVFGKSRFWAPQILKAGPEYLLTYTADEHIALARSAALTGPYRQAAVGPIDDSERNIDSFIFRDDDGRTYLYHVRFQRGNFLWVGEFDLAAGRIKPGTLQPCFRQTQPWEATSSYKSAPIMEGPTVLKLKGKYYLLYSANHYRSVDYAVGYAVADSPTGPWVKHEANPILHRSIVGENGSGHGDVVSGPAGKLYYVYHVHHSATSVSPRRTRIVELVLTWNDRRGHYDITVDPKSVITPRIRDTRK